MSEQKLFRVLSLDGGGAKGFYTLGILREIEALIRCPLHERFDLIFGTSTGSIPASLQRTVYWSFAELLPAISISVAA